MATIQARFFFFVFCLVQVLRAVGLVFLIVIFAGCATKQEYFPPQVISIYAVDCGTPTRPLLKAIDGDASFNSYANVLAFMENSDFLKEYAVSLENVVACFKAQSTKRAKQETVLGNT